MHASNVAAAAALVFSVVAASGLHVSAQQPAAPPGQGSPLAVETLDGTLEVLVEDHATSSRTRRYLHAPTEILELIDTQGRFPFGNLETGARVQARGRRMPGRAFDVEALQGGGGGQGEVSELSTTRTFGEQKVAVILVNFQDNPAQPYAWTHASQVTFQDTSNFMRENSYGQTWLTGDVYGWFTIPMSGGTCDQNRLATLADQAATAAGVNLGSYGRKLYAFPGNACGWWGLGSVGGFPSRAWVNGSFATKVVAHELGHNLGLHHSRSQPCDGGSCSIVDYGDDRDTMGGPGTGHYNAFQKDRLGWVNYGGSPPIQSITSSGSYRIDSLQVPGSSPKALRITKSGTISYYVEARTATGFDASYAPGVIVHTGDSATANSSNQIDLDPQSGFDSLLDPGQGFTDAGFTIRTISADAAGAWVSVTFGNAPCTMRAPTLTLTPSSVTAAAGATATFSLSIRNNDDAGCAAAAFAPSVSSASGWIASASQPSLTIAPTGTQSTSVLVTSPTWATGSATVSISVSRIGSSGAGGATSGTVTISSAPPPPPTGTCVRGVTVTDGSGGVWTIGAQLQTLRNGVHMGGGLGSEYAIVDGEVRVLGTDSRWYRWTGGGWAFGSAPTCSTTSPPPPPPPSGDCVRGAAVTDGTGATWTIGPQLQTLRNGVHAAGGYGSEYALVAGEVRVLGTDNGWWRWTGSGWTQATSPTCSTTTPPPPPSGNCVRGVTVTDGTGATWTLGPQLQTLRNGIHMGGGLGSDYAVVDGEVRVLGTDNQWWRWTGAGWSGGASAPTCGATTPPAGGNCVSGAVVTDSTGAVWTIGPQLQTLRNGVHMAGGLGSVYAVVAGEVRVLGTDNRWWQWTGSGWTPGQAPTCGLGH